MDADASTWTYLAGLNRWALYALMLLGAGSAVFVVLTPMPARIAAIAMRAVRAFAPLTAVSFIIAVGLGGAEIMTGTVDILWSPDTWSMGASTSLGKSSALGVPAMALLWAGAFFGRKPFLVAGATGGILSFLLTGHAATAEPAWLMAPAVALHLLGAAYWLGALAPLHGGTRDIDPGAAGALITAFSVRALWLVFAIVVSGIVISWVQLATPAAIATSTYGVRLAVKLALFAGLIVLAAYNKLVLTPRIVAGESEAFDGLRKIIRVEFVLILLVIGAAASLTLTEPPRTQQSHTR
ncbi:MAG: copper resistance D family protein [Rhodospirillaceae bacterium]